MDSIIVFQDVLHTKKQQNGRGWKIDEAYTLDHLGSQGILVSGRTNGIDTQIQSTENIMKNATSEISGQLELLKSRNTISSVVDSLVRHFQSQENVTDFVTHEELSFLISLGFSPTKDPHIYCSKTSKVYLVTNPEKLSPSYLGFLPNWGIELNGRYVIAKITEYRRTGSAYSLSGILEDDVPERYFLSDKAKKFLLRNLSGKHKQHIHSVPPRRSDGVREERI